MDETASAICIGVHQIPHDMSHAKASCALSFTLTHGGLSKKEVYGSAKMTFPFHAYLWI